MRNQRVCIPGILREMEEYTIGCILGIVGRNEGEHNCEVYTSRIVSDLRYRLDDVNKHCLAEFRAHWQCLDNNNQQLWQCRKFERPLNKCVFDNLVC